jgi:hypothetical protein
MEFVASKARNFLVNLHIEITICDQNWELEVYWQFRLILRISYQRNLAKLQSFRPTPSSTKLSIL